MTISNIKQFGQMLRDDVNDIEQRQLNRAFRILLYKYLIIK